MFGIGIPLDALAANCAAIGSSASTIANNDFVAGSLGSSAYMAACTSTVAKKSKIKL